MTPAVQHLGHSQEAGSDWKEELMMRYLPQVKRIVNRLASRLPSSIDIEDLYSVGVIGLMQAIDRYDPDRSNKFMTFSSHRIRGAVLSELRSQDYLSRSSRKKVREFDRAYVHLEKRLGREATDHEIAKEMNVSLDELDEAKRLSSISFISFEELGFCDTNEKSKLMKYLVDDDEDALSCAELKDIRKMLETAIAALPEKQKMVLSLYYFEELSMKETGDVLNISESRVSQIHSQAIVHLRSKLRDARGVLH
ncbi:MAG: FliA/WhiG family RNA polymerase sigma factor [Desulfobacterales bacterium]